MATSKLQALWNHPAGLKTIHFWAPTFKWGLIFANIADVKKPPEDISYPLQVALIVSGGIWTRYGTVITPKNWNISAVNAGMAATAAFQLARKFKYDFFPDQQGTTAVKQE